MAKRIDLKSGLGSVLFWSIISAAFIGPGTVTTASKAGASFGLALLWALSFSILATILLQEAAARITIASGKNLGTVIAQRYSGKGGTFLKGFLFFAVAFGCAAYQAGNILGAFSGIQLLGEFEKWYVIIGIGILASSLLWTGKFKLIANLMGAIVASMGLIFILVAFYTPYNLLDVAKAAFIPSWRSDANLLIIGLIGTTIVPYNLFLASGISKGQELREMRLGLTVAILIGGIISFAILMVGTQVTGEFSFSNLANTLSTKLGSWAADFFAFGLFAAGFTSCITAPLAAAVTAQSLFGRQEDVKWNTTGINFRLVWGSILGIGLLFSLTNVQAIPVIITAQALNGLLLPVIAIFLVLTMNDSDLLGKYINSRLTNILMLIVLFVCCFLGANNLLKAFQRTLSEEFLNIQEVQVIALLLSLIIVVLVSWNLFKKEKGN